MLLVHYSALNQLAEVALASDDASEVLDAMARIVGGLLPVDRSLVYDVRLDEGVTVCRAEWLRPNVPGNSPSRGTYPLTTFGDAAELLFRERAIITSHRSRPHPSIGPVGWELLHGQLNVGSLLWHPFAFRAGGYHILAFNQLTEHGWTDTEVEFVKAVGHQVSLALVKLELTAERANTHNALAASEARYRALYDLTPSMFFTLDENLTVIAANRFALEHLGYSEADIVGRPSLECVPDSDRAHIRQELERCLGEPGRVFRWDGHCTLANGTSVAIRQTGRAGPAPDGRTLLFIEATDISEQRQTEAALIHAQKCETLGLLVGSIAHDFNNLLGTIAGNADLALRRLEPTSAAHGPVTHAKVAATRAAELVRQLLAYSAQAPVVRDLVDVNALVREITGLLEVTVGRRARMVLALDESLPTIVDDGTQIRQVLMNLVQNGADAIEGFDGEIRIETRSILEGLESTHRAVELAVSDSGVGMPSDVLGRIFDPFFTTKVAGRGLGLFAVRTIVERHGGRIAVESAVGRGSTFRVVLPARAAEPHEVAVPSVREPTVRSKPAALILVVDDERPLLDVVGTFVREFGDATIEASSVEDALIAFDENPAIECVLVDLTMPRGGGNVLARAFKAKRPATPIVLMSGFANSEVTASLEGFLDATLAKPFTPADLQRTIDRVLGR